MKTVVKTAADAESLDPDCRCHYQKPLEWCYGAVSSFLANPPGLGEVCNSCSDSSREVGFPVLELYGGCTILEVSLALKDPVLEVTHGIGYFLKSGLALKNVFICVAEIRVLLVADKLHRSSVETIAAYMLLAPTYDLHVVQFYESVVR